jgi:hypothetical protein
MSAICRTFLVFLFALSVLSSTTALSFQASKEQKPNQNVTSSAPARVEPVRVVNGRMKGRVISGQFTRNGRLSDFSLALSKAEIVGGKLELIGDFRAGAADRVGQNVRSTIAGTMAMAANPWPHASDEDAEEAPKSSDEQKQGREAKNPETAGQFGQLAQSTQDTARKTPPAPGKPIKKKEPVYGEIENISGCGVLFLSLDLPLRLRTAMSAGRALQMGVVLAPLDNRVGEEINKRICAIVRMLNDKSDAQSISAGLIELNRLLSGAQ